MEKYAVRLEAEGFMLFFEGDLQPVHMGCFCTRVVIAESSEAAKGIAIKKLEKELITTDGIFFDKSIHLSIKVDDLSIVSPDFNEKGGFTFYKV